MSKSPLLQDWLNARSNQQGPAAGASGPVVNVVLPNNPFGLYQDFNLNTFSHQGATRPTASSSNISKGLIPEGYIEGSHMDLETFCVIFNVPNSIQDQLKENEITGTHAFIHMSTDDLRDMGFKIGQTIDLKEAIKKWVQEK